MTQNNRTAWFTDARFGISLHWGLYSIAAQGEWLRSNQKMAEADYMKYFHTFNPEKGCCEKWADLAVQAGAKYMVLTSKHHDGFCLFDSKQTDFNSMHTPAGRDLIAEYVNACRSRGLKVGIYYSMVDWHHPDYPTYGDRQHPLRTDLAEKEKEPERVWQRYLNYAHSQVEELLTNYGKIDLLVFDFSYWDFHGEKWGAAELMKKIRALQPHILVNDRLGKEALLRGDQGAWCGDYDQTEQDIPRKQMKNKKGEPIPWEGWITINNNWCHAPFDREVKSSKTIVRSLVNCVSKGGNLLVNINPNSLGQFDPVHETVLKEVGDWLSQNGESIYGCSASSLEKPEWGRWTEKGGNLYAHILEQPIGHLTLPHLRGEVEDGRILATNTEAFVCDYWNAGIQTFDEPDDIFLALNKPHHGTWILPDETDTVVRLKRTDSDRKNEILKQLKTNFEKATAQVPG